MRCSLRNGKGAERLQRPSTEITPPRGHHTKPKVAHLHNEADELWPLVSHIQVAVPVRQGSNKGIS